MVEWHKLVKRRKKVEVLKKGAREEGHEADVADEEINENENSDGSSYEEVMEPHNTTMQLAWWAFLRDHYGMTWEEDPDGTGFSNLPACDLVCVECSRQDKTLVHYGNPLTDNIIARNLFHTDSDRTQQQQEATTTTTTTTDRTQQELSSTTSTTTTTTTTTTLSNVKMSGSGRMQLVMLRLHYPKICIA